MTTVKELKKYIKQYYKNDEHIAYQLWSRLDVEETLDRLEVFLSDDQIAEIIDCLHYDDTRYLLENLIKEYLKEKA